MPNPATLKYALFCDLAIVEAITSKVTLAGCFDQILHQAPGVFPGQFCFSFQVAAVPGEHSVRILVRDDGGHDILPPFGPVKMAISENGLGNYHLGMRGFPIPRHGQFHFLVEFGGKQIGEGLLTIAPPKA